MMKSQHLALVVLLLLTSLLCSGVSAETGLVGYWSFDNAPACNPGPNIVLNPSFESGMENWQGTCPEGVVCSIDDSTSSDRTFSFKAHFTGTDVNFYQIYQWIDVDPDTYYELRYWLKTEDMTHLTRLEYLLYNGSAPIQCEGSFCYAFGVTGHPAGTHDWRELVTYFKTTPDTTRIKIRPRKYSDGSPTTGTAWWDNITLKKIGSITIPDDSGNGNNGELYEAVCTQGISGKAFQFDGSNDRIYIPDSTSLDITHNITIDMWVKGYSSEQGRKSVYLLGKEYAYLIQAGRGGAEEFTPDLAFKVMNSANSTWYSEQTLENVLDGNWHNIVGVFDGTKLQVFVDDVYKGETRVTNLYSRYWFNNDTIFSSGRPLFIGSYKNSTGTFRGSIDEVRIYNRTTHYFGYGSYTLYPGDSVYINDYSNYHLDNFVFRLLSLNGYARLEKKSGSQKEEYTLHIGDALRFKNTEVRLDTNNGEKATLSFSPIAFPTPKYINITGVGFTPDGNTKIIIGNDSGSYENAQILRAYLSNNYGISPAIEKDYEISQQHNIILIGSRANNSILDEKARNIGISMPPGNEGFNIFSDNDFLLIESNSETGGYYAVIEVIHLLERGEGTLPALEIIDYPTVRGMRSFHFPTVNDKRINDGFLKNYIKKLSELRFNTLFLLIDGGGDGGMQIQLDSHPEVSKSDAISKQEMRDIIDYARSLHMQVIPQINSVSKGHMLIGNSHPELMLNNYTLDFSKPYTYTLVLDIANEVADLFNSTYLHIGNDELYGYVGKSLGTSDPIMSPEQFAEAITRVHDNLSSRGIKSIMWGDMLLNPSDFPNEGGCHGGYNDIYKTADQIPNDIIIADWHYKYWRSKDFPSVDYFQKKGFPVIGATWDNRDTMNYFSKYIAERQNTSLTYGMMGTIWFPFNRADNYTIDIIIDESAEAFWSGGTALNLCTDSDGDDFYFEAGGCSSVQGFLGHNDCNDTNIEINPGASEICGNGIDENCDGHDLPCSPYSADTNHDGCIETSELVAFIRQWFSGEVLMKEMMETIIYWKSGNGC